MRRNMERGWRKVAGDSGLEGPADWDNPKAVSESDHSILWSTQGPDHR